MDEQLQSISSPKQDRMISLIAWLIVMCLLFYLTVLTFEAFLRITPEIQVTQQVDQTGVESQNQSAEPQVAMVDAVDLPAEFTADEVAVELTSEDVITDQIETVDPVENVERAERSMDFVDELAVPVSEPEPEPTLNDVTVRDVKPETKSIDEKALMGSVTRELAVLTPNLSQLRLGKTFDSRSEAFNYLKQIDYGELDVSLELVQRAGVVNVFVGGIMPKSDVDRLQQYMAVRNNGLVMNTLGSQEREDLLKASAATNASFQARSSVDTFVPDNNMVGQTSIPTRGSDNFWNEAKLKPFTIQIGSFLRMSNARSLSDQLRGKSFASDVETYSLGGVEQFRVLVGNFLTRAEASKFATQLSEKEALPVYVRSASMR